MRDFFCANLSCTSDWLFYCICKPMTEKRKIIHALVFPLFFLLLMWINYLAFWILDLDMSLIGISPTKISGLLGIMLSPFAHGGWTHLIANSISFIILGTLLFYFYRLVAYPVFFINWFISGILLWFGGRTTIHIGASGLVYGLAFFIFFSGVFRKDKRLGALSMIVVFLYGSMVWGMVPQGGNISWEGHLFGALSGISLAWYFRKKTIDFIPEPDGSSVSVTWGQFNDMAYHYVEDEEEPEVNNDPSMDAKMQ
ncbi:MAG: rhomboid family intramembrane serine protease [Salinivirgaceae bacterium]